MAAGIVVIGVAVLIVMIIRTCKAFRSDALARISRKIDEISKT
jgi:hypothetical protein